MKSVSENHICAIRVNVLHIFDHNRCSQAIHLIAPKLAHSMFIGIGIKKLDAGIIGVRQFDAWDHLAFKHTV